MSKKECLKRINEMRHLFYKYDGRKKISIVRFRELLTILENQIEDAFKKKEQQK